MTKKVIAFVGTDEKLYILKGFRMPFEQAGWKILEFNSCEEAKESGEEIDVQVVWGFMDWYVDEYQNWENPPTTIWCCISEFDTSPDSATRLVGGLKPSKVFAAVSQVLGD